MTLRIFKWTEHSDRYAMAAGVDSQESLFLSPSTSLADLSRPVRLRIVREPGRELPVGDFLGTGLAQRKILSCRAKESLSDFLGHSGSFHPAELVGDSIQLWLWTSSIIGDCLDLERSRTFESLSGHIRLDDPTFVAERVPRLPFVVRGYEHQSVWVTEEFKIAVAEAGLQGAAFGKCVRVLTGVV